MNATVVELLDAHAMLDKRGVPRAGEDGRRFSLKLRIALLAPVSELDTLRDELNRERSASRILLRERDEARAALDGEEWRVVARGRISQGEVERPVRGDRYDDTFESEDRARACASRLSTDFGPSIRYAVQRREVGPWRDTAAELTTTEEDRAS